MAGLPAAVRAAIDERLQGKARGDLARRYAAVSADYRRGANSAASLRTDDDALAYAAARMPATFAAVRHALSALAAAAPDIQPRSLIDAGCGPGTAAMAAADAFPSLRAIALIDRNAPLLALSQNLVPAAAPAAVLDIRRAELDPPPPLPDADLCVAAYVLAELTPAAGVRLAEALWRATAQALVLVEPGTPDGFLRLKALRERLLAAGAHAAAPCTHHAPCPMAGDRWCRVPVRVERSRDHRAIKGGALGHEDEPVAYLALTREPPAARRERRIIGPARLSKAGIALDVCGADGLTTIDAARRDGEKFKEYKRLDWGDAI